MKTKNNSSAHALTCFQQVAKRKVVEAKFARSKQQANLQKKWLVFLFLIAKILKNKYEVQT